MKREREREDGAERQRDERKEGQNKKRKKKEKREGCWTGPESEHILSVCEPSGV